MDFERGGRGAEGEAMKVEVCILAGGKSQRMGRAKSGVRVGGATLLEWSLLTARGAGFPYRVVEKDLGESRGPVSGIVTALKTTRADAVIFLSCDMPFVRSATLRELASRDGKLVFAESNGLAGFPFLVRKGAKIERESLQELARGAMRTRISGEEAFNVNTPADLAEAERRFEARRREVVLEVDGLGIRRGEVEILRDVNWTVRKGEHWAILGANGSGKTSLLSALTGYMSATRGRIRLLGREFGRSDWRELRKRVGLVSSSVRQLMAESETALETVATGKAGVIDQWGPLKRGERIRARAILNDLGCGYLEKRVWAVLSQGERQRVLIGRALMAAPEALILDEPCAGLDPAARERFLEFIQELTERSTSPAIILVTHHVEEIVPGLTHVMALKGGTLVAAGPKPKTLTGRLISEVFDCEARLNKARNRYHLQISVAKSLVP